MGTRIGRGVEPRTFDGRVYRSEYTCFDLAYVEEEVAAWLGHKLEASTDRAATRQPKSSQRSPTPVATLRLASIYRRRPSLRQDFRRRGLRQF